MSTLPSFSPSAAKATISVLVPAHNEALNLPLFMSEAKAALISQANCATSYEVVVIDAGSTDDTWVVLQDLVIQYPFLRLVRHRSRRGIAECLRNGYLNARGDILVFYPADLQYKPKDIPSLVAPILADEADMVTGYKQGVYEKAFVSNIYNHLSRRLFKVPVRDLNSVKAYRRIIMDNLPVRPDWHRYLVVMAAAQGFTISEVPVPLYARHAGKSKFGLSRIPVGVLDMLSVWFELRFAAKPLLLFGMLGAGLFTFGFLAGLFAIGWRLVAGEGFRPLLNLIETCLIVGSVFFCTGLIGELIAAQRSELRDLRRRLDETLPPSEVI